MKEIVTLAQGNPGALVFLMSLFEEKNLPFALTIMAKIIACELKGTEIYVLYSDLGNKQVERVLKICDLVPVSVLRDACSRQDYSGRELITPYL